MKVGRNDLCPCGSGKKFKKCHFAIPMRPPVLKPPVRPNSLPPGLTEKAQAHFSEQERIAKEHNEKFGAVPSIIHIRTQIGKRLVAVRNRIYQVDERQTFTDFLFDYGKDKFGTDWINIQKSAAPHDRHPLYLWSKAAAAFMNKHTPQADGLCSAAPNGALASCNNFYYDLYIADHNLYLDDNLMSRLKHREQFQGAMHELFAAATCLRAGFSIIKEDETDRTRKHTEFIALHRSTGQHVAVEAKSRHRPGVLALPGVQNTDIRFGGLINDAAQKDPNNPLAIFLDTNLPPEDAKPFYEPSSRDPITPSPAMSKFMKTIHKEHGGVDPFNLLILSNHPQHYATGDDIAPGSRWAAFVSNRPRVQVFNQQALFELAQAANFYGNVPSLFPADSSI